MAFSNRVASWFPENIHPILLCEGSCGKQEHRPHTFRRRQRNQDVIGGQTYYELFACDTCGHERVYGAMEV